MKEITFTGTLTEVYERAQEWKLSNPDVEIIDDRLPIKVDFADHQTMRDENDWSITVEYKD